MRRSMWRPLCDCSVAQMKPPRAAGVCWDSQSVKCVVALSVAKFCDVALAAQAAASEMRCGPARARGRTNRQSRSSGSEGCRALAIAAESSGGRRQHERCYTGIFERSSERVLGIQYIDSRATPEVMQADEIQRVWQVGCRSRKQTSGLGSKPIRLPSALFSTTTGPGHDMLR